VSLGINIFQYRNRGRGRECRSRGGDGRANNLCT